MDKGRLTVVMITFNCQNKIRDALESIRWAEEIIVLDGGSADATVTIGRQYTEKVVRQPSDISLRRGDNIDLTKNAGFHMATCPWILSLDSDEIVPEGLAKEIRSVIALESSPDGFYIPRENYYWGHPVRLLQPDYQLRLFKQGKGEFLGTHIHEKLQVDGKTGYLNAALLHRAYDSPLDFIRRAFIYSKNETRYLKTLQERKNILKVFAYPLSYFYYYYVKQKSYKDGFTGFVVCLLYSFYHFLYYARFILKK
jgi:glycosyltransferase involved in cell wall biosynthesis